MELSFDLPIDGPIDEAALDAGGTGKVQPGWYLVRLEDVYPDPETAGMKLKYEILSEGPFKGKTVPDTLWDPREADDDDKAKRTQERLLMITRRLGAREDNSAHIDFQKALGGEFVIHLARPQTKTCVPCATDAPKGSRKQKCERCGVKYTWREDSNDFANITWDGVYPQDHDKIPDEVRAALAIQVPKREPLPKSPAAAKTQPATAVKPKATAVAAAPAVASKPAEPNIDDL